MFVHWFCGWNFSCYDFLRLGFSSWQIKRAIVELDHVTFVDQPPQIGREGRACVIRHSSVGNITNQFFKKLFAIDYLLSLPALRESHSPIEILQLVREQSGRVRIGETNNIPRRCRKTWSPFLSKSTGQLLHHRSKASAFPAPTHPRPPD